MMTFLLSPPSSSYLDLHFSNDKVCLPRLLSKRYVLQKNSCRSLNLYKIQCKLSMVKRSSSEDNLSLVKEPHKYFDQVIITVRAGDGGHGAILTMPNQRVSKPQGRHEKEKNKKRSPSLKRDFDGSLVLPVGGIGGDIVIYADERKDTLLEFHTKKRYSAKRGGNVDSMGDLASQFRNGLAGPTLRIPVPVGTVVKLKRGKLLADLSLPGDEVLVARGGQGGISLVEVPENRRKKMMALTTNVMRDDSDKVLVHGQPGEEVSLELILRVVADVGLVGLPNAGKSTLLAAITRAKPDIADYPFTTLMPNLGRLDGDPLLGPGAFSSEATLADLPGLIEGAHLGKGLGRNFLRHLRRTRLLVHVVDAAAENPVNDYRTVREELRMYNPEYTRRPYIVVLNKMDLPQARDRLPSLSEEIVKFVFDKSPSGPEKSSEDGGIESPKSEYRGEDEDEDEDESSLGASKEDEDDQEMEDSLGPVAVVGVSVLKGINIDQMLKQIRAALRELRDPMVTQ